MRSSENETKRMMDDIDSNDSMWNSFRFSRKTREEVLSNTREVNLSGEFRPQLIWVDNLYPEDASLCRNMMKHAATWLYLQSSCNAVW